MRDLHEYSARDAKRQADALVRRIRADVQRLEQFPLSGRVIPERGQTPWREIVEVSRALSAVQGQVADGKVRRVVYVPGRVITIVG